MSRRATQPGARSRSLHPGSSSRLVPSKAACRMGNLPLTAIASDEYGPATPAFSRQALASLPRSTSNSASSPASTQARRRTTGSPGMSTSPSCGMVRYLARRWRELRTLRKFVNIKETCSNSVIWLKAIEMTVARVPRGTLVHKPPMANRHMSVLNTRNTRDCTHALQTWKIRYWQRMMQDIWWLYRIMKSSNIPFTRIETQLASTVAWRS
mmetsp:Transcript_28748/g.72771  ORF Transcript_28748/g.72771 Transcript_28748/m.72771 type:complete len:211 (+) Transcript_28748:1075-1707(+)